MVLKALRVPLSTIALLVGGALWGANAMSAPTVNKFDPTATVGGVPLVLNGKGTRYKVVVKVYDMPLYTTKRVDTPGALLALDGAKKLSFVALRELSGTDLGRLFVRGMSDNASKQQLLPHTVATSRLIEVFSGKSKLSAGDTFAMEYVPGKGTTFFIQGVPQGAPVGNDEFFALVLRVWFGDSPADWKLRDGLLDGARD